MADINLWSSVGQAATYLVLGCSIVLLNHLREKAKEWYAKRKLHPIARAVLANRRVHNLLIELRTKTDADRACVFLFHNGQNFSNKNPLWRLSCTQEYCRDGVTHEIDGLQNILSSIYWDGLAVFFANKDEKEAGIETHTYGQNKVYLINVHALDDSYYKRSLVARGIKLKFSTPMLDSKSEVVGFVCLNYCDDNLGVPLDIIVSELSESSQNINYELSRP